MSSAVSPLYPGCLQKEETISTLFGQFLDLWVQIPGMPLSYHGQSRVKAAPSEEKLLKSHFCGFLPKSYLFYRGYSCVVLFHFPLFPLAGAAAE